jgi:glycosyltransferase involved in cell wall biosynthesis
MPDKVLFVHDGPLLKNSEKGEFYAVHYSDKIINRYRFFAPNVTFLMRGKEVNSEQASKYSQIRDENFRHIEIPNFKSLGTLHKKKDAAKIIKQAVDDHDMLIARIPSAAGTIAINHARQTGKPVLVECVACVYDALWNYNWKGKMLAHYKFWQMKRLMASATHSIYVTSEFLQGRYPTQGNHIGCSDVVLKEYEASTLEVRLNRIASRDSSPLLIGTVAALDVPYKGQADVIRAVGELKKEGVDVEYKLVGQGDTSRMERAIKEADAGDRVEIVGPLPHSKVFDFLDEIDVYIQPSRQEGLPRAMIEALSRGCLATGARTAGIPELIEDDFVFEAGDIRQIKEIISDITVDKLAAQAKRNFREAANYREEQLDKRRVDFYEQFKRDHKF